MLARSHYSSGNWEEAYKTCSDLLIESPENLTALRLRMRSLRNLDDKTGAGISAAELFESERGGYRGAENNDSEFGIAGGLGRSRRTSRNSYMENGALKPEAARWRARSLSRQNDQAWGGSTTIGWSGCRSIG